MQGSIKAHLQSTAQMQKCNKKQATKPGKFMEQLSISTLIFTANCCSKIIKGTYNLEGPEFLLYRQVKRAKQLRTEPHNLEIQQTQKAHISPYIGRQTHINNSSPSRAQFIYHNINKQYYKIRKPWVMDFIRTGNTFTKSTGPNFEHSSWTSCCSSEHKCSSSY